MKAAISVLGWLAACTTPEGRVEVGDRPLPASTPTVGSPANGLDLVDIEMLPAKWTAASGWEIVGTTVLDDVTDDGLADAAVYVGEIGGVAQNVRTLLVAGPLRRALTLPGDESATFLRSADAITGDATGDGVPDLRIQAESGPDTFYFLLEAPFSGVIEPPVSGMRIYGDVSDVDGDGVLDQTHGIDQEIRVTWGPSSRWSGPPDLVIEPSCDGEYADDYGYISTDHVDAHPDVDGDGQREVWFDDDSQHVCKSWLFPLPTAGGTYVPSADPAAMYGVRDFEIIGDQTGDGIADVWTWYDRQVHAAPVSFASGAVTSAQTLQADDDLYRILPIRYDLDSDGLTDFVAMDAEVDRSEVIVSTDGPIDRVSGEVLVVVPGGAAIEGPTYGTVWDIHDRNFQADDVLLEDGTVSVLIQSAGEVIVVDLGVGTVP